MLVQHWMTRDVVTVEAGTPFLEARLILKYELNYLLLRMKVRDLIT